MNFLMMGLLALAGMGIPVQVAANRRLEQSAHSPALSTALAFAVGAIVMGVVAITGIAGRGTMGGLTTAPWWAWVGGAISALVVLASTIALSKTGAEQIIAATVFGQLVAAALIDHFGWLGVKQQPVNAWRITGALVLFAGALIMQKKS